MNDLDSDDQKGFKVPLQLGRTAPLPGEAAQLGGQQVTLETICICFLISVYFSFVFVYFSMTVAGNYLYFFSCICVYFLLLCICQ